MATVRKCRRRRHCGCGCSCNATTTNCGCTSSSCDCSNTCSSSSNCNCNNFGCLNCIPSACCGCGNYAEFPYYTGPCGPVESCENCCCPWLPSCCGCGSNCGCNTDCNCNTENCECGESSSCNCNNCCAKCGCHQHCCHRCGCCNQCCNCENNCVNCSICCPKPAASFTSGTPVALSAGGMIPFLASTSNTDTVAATQGGVLIRCAGTYMVTYSVNLPANEAVTSQFYLQLNGQTIPASVRDVVSTADTTTTSVTVQLLVQAQANSLLSLASANAVTIATPGYPNVFNLTILRVF